jgi:predicted GNAT family acetyltransferase
MSGRDDVLLSRDYRGRVTGLAYFGAQLVVAADDDAALDAFAVEARKHRGLRSFVGPKQAVDGIWERVRTWHLAPQMVRDVQPLYVLPQGSLRRVEPDVEARRAGEDEAELVAENSAQMIVGELGYDPRVARGAFVNVVRRAIAAGHWWVWIVDGALRFQCNVGPRTAATAQIQGVWTPPEARGRGWATLGFAAVARRLLATEPTLSLYVNDFNAPAIALYERLGFVRAGTFATYLFP